MVQAEAHLPKRETVKTEVVHEWASERFHEWEIKAVNPDRKRKYEVAPKCAVFKSLEPENR